MAVGVSSRASRACITRRLTKTQVHPTVSGRADSVVMVEEVDGADELVEVAIQHKVANLIVEGIRKPSPLVVSI